MRSAFVLTTIVIQSTLCVSVQSATQYVHSEIHAQDQSESEYRIRPKDLLYIRIERACIISPTFEVDDQGILHMVFIGDVQAADKTTTELENEIIVKLKKYQKVPKVHIRVIERRA